MMISVTVTVSHRRSKAEPLSVRFSEAAAGRSAGAPPTLHSFCAPKIDEAVSLVVTPQRGIKSESPSRSMIRPVSIITHPSRMRHGALE